MRTMAFLLVALAVGQARAQDALGPMKYNEVRQIAPGVFFRFSAISATDKNVVFGGSNNIWIVFDDYVLVFDANFPKEAGDVIEAIRKTTDKPIRYVLDSHHHGDHAYGNAVFSKAGASVIASANTARILRTTGPAEFEKEGKGPTGRKDVRESYLKVPDVVFDDKLVLEDSKQRVELYHFGHAHTAGDSFLYLPAHKILCTGDACTNGPFNYMGHADSASWIRVLEKAQTLDVKLVCPGHGPLSDTSVLANQRRYFVELRAQVKAGLDANKDADDIIKSIDMPWHKEWTGIEARERVDNIKHVYDEFTGRTMPFDLIEDFGLYEGPSPTKATPGWTAPKKIIVPTLMPARLRELKLIAPEVLFVPVKTPEDAAKEASDADAVVGFVTADIVRAGKRLRWLQTGHAGVEKDLVLELVKSDITLTNTQRIYGPNVADQAMALLLVFTRRMQRAHFETMQTWVNPRWGTGIGAGPGTFWFQNQWSAAGPLLTKTEGLDELRGKTMLIVGFGGIGNEIARRAEGFGMRVRALDPNPKLTPPRTVMSIERPDKLMERLPEADVVVLACPLTAETRGMIAKKQFEAMKKSALLINVGRGGLVDTRDLAKALSKSIIAGAGLDVTDPEPLPDDHPLWRTNVVISPHTGGQSPGAEDRRWRMFRENIRRFVAGEALLGVVDKQRGY